MGIGEVAIERESNIFRMLIHRRMQQLDFARARRNLAKSRVELCKVVHFDHDMELTEIAGAEAELSARDTESCDAPRIPKPSEIGIHVLAEVEI
jgi:hypothetical protein